MPRDLAQASASTLPCSAVTRAADRALRCFEHLAGAERHTTPPVERDRTPVVGGRPRAAHDGVDVGGRRRREPFAVTAPVAGLVMSAKRADVPSHGFPSTQWTISGIVIAALLLGRFRDFAVTKDRQRPAQGPAQGEP